MSNLIKGLLVFIVRAITLIGTRTYQFLDCKGDKGTQFVISGHTMKVVFANLPVVTVKYNSKGASYVVEESGEIIDKKPTSGYIINDSTVNSDTDFESVSPVAGILFTGEGQWFLNPTFYGQPKREELDKGWEYYKYGNTIYTQLGRENFVCGIKKYRATFGVW